MKKLCAYLMALILICACLPGLAQSEMYTRVMSRFNGQLETGKTVKVLENATAIELGYVDELIAAFNEAYASQGISAAKMDIDQYSDLATDGPYGYGPDVWYQANDILMKYATKQHLLPLPVEGMECRSLIPQNAWNAYKLTMYDEDFYCGVPVNVPCVGCEASAKVSVSPSASVPVRVMESGMSSSVVSRRAVATAVL